MNYRHAFHAGNHADVLKHCILLALIDALQQKSTPLFVLDTHAGRGQYLLTSEQAGKTGEFKDGILKLLGASDLPAPVQRYLRAVQADNPVGALVEYPGSPLLIAQALRDHDRLAACELQPEEAAALKSLFKGDTRVGVHQRNGYEAMPALLPPKEKRGLVLIDPPYEAQDEEYPRIVEALKLALTRWPTGQFAIWYPIKRRATLQPFFRKVAHLPVKSALAIELLVRPDDSPLRMNGSGMLLLNPPWQFDQLIEPCLRELARLLGERGASWRQTWLIEPK
ncbi:MAG TPA: 23S rRNA (adenine(2030)-N(6))-methyltransferase RlmJ [Arenimonas sp.]|nr:23S rRNA (adenine(2030)-N(6))-methyltransferase RlmJ [Arenimonas sp.]